MHVARSWKKCTIMICSLRRHLERLQATKPQSPRKHASNLAQGQGILRTRVVLSQFYKPRTLQHLCCSILLLSNYVLLMKYSMIQKGLERGGPRIPCLRVSVWPTYAVQHSWTRHYILLRILDLWVSSSYNWRWTFQAFAHTILKAPPSLRHFVQKHLTNHWHMKTKQHKIIIPQWTTTPNKSNSKHKHVKRKQVSQSYKLTRQDNQRCNLDKKRTK